MGTFMIYLIQFDMPGSNYSQVTVIEPKAKQNLLMAAMLFYIS
jgi:hypothetical protein